LVILFRPFGLVAPKDFAKFCWATEIIVLNDFGVMKSSFGLTFIGEKIDIVIKK
jgi:hypothetical protein